MHIKKWIGHLRRRLYYIHHKQFLQAFEDRSLAQAQPVFYKRKRVNVMYITNTFAIFRRLVSTHTGTWVAWKSKLCRKFAAGFSTTAGTMGAGEGRVPWTSGAIKAISTTAHAKQYHQRGGGVIKNWRVIMVSTNDIVRMKVIGTSLNIENGMRNIFVIAVWKFVV